MASGCVFVDLSEEPGSLASFIRVTAEALEGNLCECSECRAVHQYLKAFWKETENQVFHPSQIVLRQLSISDPKSQREAKTINYINLLIKRKTQKSRIFHCRWQKKDFNDFKLKKNNMKV